MRARVVAPVVAAVLGIAGGATTALVAPGAGGSGAAVAADPLHLGIDLVNQPCDQRSITVLAYGGEASALSAAVANADGEVRYLQSARSCDTVYGPDSDPHPTYVVYAGPFPKPSEPCATRMQGDDGRGSVTRLRAGNQDFVKCACVLDSDVGPQLHVDMAPTARDVAWIRLLQIMLRDDDPRAFPGSAVTGRYDQRTAQRVADYQADSPGMLTTPGVVDARTWSILTRRLCRNYSW